MMIMTNSARGSSKNCCLAVAVVFAAFICTISCTPAGLYGEINIDHLMKIIRAIRNPSKASVASDDVLAAYNEYVSLHLIQTELAGHYDEEGTDEQTVAEKKYVEVGELLQMPELQVLSQTLFNVIQEDYTAGRVSMTNKLRAKLNSAIRTIF